MKLKIKVSPNAKKNIVVGWFGDQLKIKIASLPEKGKANEELVEFLSSELDLPKSSFKIVRGRTSSSKLLEISDLCEESLVKKLKLKKIQDSLL